MTCYELHYEDEWAALYVDGKLVTVGDAYSSEEYAFSLLGVKQVHDNAFMRGQNGRDGVAQTLDEAAVYRAGLDEKVAEADRLRLEVNRLLSRIDELNA
jgi:hypothetical protein